MNFQGFATSLLQFMAKGASESDFLKVFLSLASHCQGSRLNEFTFPCVHRSLKRVKLFGENIPKMRNVRNGVDF